MGAPADAWVVSRRSGWRAFWGLVGIIVFGAAAVAALVAFVKAPHVDSGVLVAITLPFFVMAVVLAWEAVALGLVRLDAAGYSTPLGRRRAWGDVLAIGTGEVDGRTTPVVALRDGDGIGQDTFPGFADGEADRLVDALRSRVTPAGFGSVVLGAQWWAAVDAEADRAVAVVRETSGREPLSRQRVPFGYPGLSNAVRLDYGVNDAGERIELIVRDVCELAVTASGRRWLRQNHKRSADPATQVGLLFGPHTATIVPSKGAGFDQWVVSIPDQRRLRFNAEEPDRYAEDAGPTSTQTLN